MEVLFSENSMIFQIIKNNSNTIIFSFSFILLCSFLIDKKFPKNSKPKILTIDEKLNMSLNEIIKYDINNL